MAKQVPSSVCGSELVDYLSALLNGENENIPKDIFREYLKSILAKNELSDRSLQANRWLHWAKGNAHIKCIEAEVPDGILPAGCHGTLIDAKVFSKRGPDDAIYDNNDDIRRQVARGNCFLKIGDEINCIVYALKKFTGGLGDDDDKKEGGDDFTWKKYFTKDLTEVESICATRKANGEAAHLSCVDIKGERIICAGSKNVHLLFNNRDDIRKYKDDRFRIAKEVAFCVFDFLDKMDETSKKWLLEFLCVTHFTAVFEILSPLHQHVENLSHLESPKLKFITWTISSNLDTDDLCCVVPHIGIEIGRILKLDTVEYSLIPRSELESQMMKVRRGYNFEGEVFYFLDSKNNVVGLLKKKTAWYIICRAIREKSKSAVAAAIKSKDFKDTKAINKAKRRIREIQTWLKLDEATTSKWQSLAENYISWCLEKVQSLAVERDDLMDKFPVLWKQFLTEKNETDEIVAKFINS